MAEAQGTTDHGALLLPNAPNWYCAYGFSLFTDAAIDFSNFSLTGAYRKIADWSAENLIAFGAKNSIYLFDAKVGRFIAVLSAHADRLCAVEFSRTRAAILYSAGADRILRAWDVHRGTVVVSHNAHKTEITSLAVSALLPDSVVSGDKSGKLVLWRHSTQEITLRAPIAEAISCLALSPAIAQHCFIGYHSGALVHVNITTGEIIARLHGHSAEIQRLQFSPRVERFASSSRDRTIRVWEVQGSVCKTIQTLSLPSGGAGRLTDAQRERLWFTVCWLSAEELVSSSHMGELLFWSLKQRDPIRRLQAHTRPVFSLLLSPDRSSLLSISMDRLLQFWEVTTGKQLFRIASLGGFAYSLHCSALEPGKLLVGVGDNTLRVWNTAAKDLYDCSIVWPKGVQTKITAVCWHPSIAGLYALGTEDGVLVCFDINSGAQASKGAGGSFVTAHPNASVKGIAFHVTDLVTELWSVGTDGRLLVHRCNQQGALTDCKTWEDTATHDISSRANASHSCFAWAGSGIVIGDTDGWVHFYDEQFDFPLGWRTGGPKQQVHCVAVHSKPGVTMVAAARGDCVISIYYVDSEGEHEVDCIPAELSHVNTITSLEFCSYGGTTYLLSASHDRTAQVWQVARTSNRGIASLRGHTGRVLAATWSTETPEVVFTASDDQTVRRWDLKKAYAYSVPPRNVTDSMTSGSGKKRRASSPESPALPSPLAAAPSTTSLPAPTALVSAHQPSSLNTTSSGGHIRAAPPPRRVKKGDVPKEVVITPMFTELRKEDAAMTDCVTLAAALSQAPSSVTPSLFGSRMQCLSYLNDEAARLSTRSAPLEASAVRMWSGNLADSIRLGLQADPCNLLWTALAASGGRELWMRTAHVQALALESAGRVNEAAQLLLAAVGAREAIAVYQRAGQWLEALALAQAQLTEHDVVITDLRSNYLASLQAKKLPHQTARCMLSLGRTADAVQLLTSTGMSAALSAATAVASSLSVPPHELLVLRRRLGAQLFAEGKCGEARKLFCEHGITASLLVAATEQTLSNASVKASVEAEAGEVEEEGRELSNSEIAALPPSKLRALVTSSKLFKLIWAAWCSDCPAILSKAAELLASLHEDDSFATRAYKRVSGQIATCTTYALLLLLLGRDAEFSANWLQLEQLFTRNNEWLDFIIFCDLLIPAPSEELVQLLSNSDSMGLAACVLASRVYACYWHRRAVSPSDITSGVALCNFLNSAAAVVLQDLLLLQCDSLGQIVARLQSKYSK